MVQRRDGPGFLLETGAVPSLQKLDRDYAN
jgi:hypothetical protein